MEKYEIVEGFKSNVMCKSLTIAKRIASTRQKFIGSDLEIRSDDKLVSIKKYGVNIWEDNPHKKQKYCVACIDMRDEISMEIHEADNETKAMLKHSIVEIEKLENYKGDIKEALLARGILIETIKV